MSDIFQLLAEKRYIVQKLKASREDHLKWVSIQPISDKNTYGTAINPNSLETIFSIFTFEMHKHFIGREDEDITINQGINLERRCVDSVDQVIEYLKAKEIDLYSFIRVLDDPEYPL